MLKEYETKEIKVEDSLQESYVNIEIVFSCKFEIFGITEHSKFVKS